MTTTNIMTMNQRRVDLVLRDFSASCPIFWAVSFILAIDTMIKNKTEIKFLYELYCKYIFVKKIKTRMYFVFIFLFSDENMYGYFTSVKSSSFENRTLPRGVSHSARYPIGSMTTAFCVSGSPKISPTAVGSNPSIAHESIWSSAQAARANP